MPKWIKSLYIYMLHFDADIRQLYITPDGNVRSFKYLKSYETRMSIQEYINRMKKL